MQRVLLVSGDSELRQEMRDFFVKDLEVGADEAEHTDSALGLLKAQRYNLVVVDLPEPFSGEIVRAVCSEGVYPPPVLVLEQGASAEREVQTHGVFYLDKPVDMAVFFECVVSCL
jgi:DNA-binding response OmpR family regulator